MEKIDLPFKLKEYKTDAGLKVIVLNTKSKVNYVSLTSFSGYNNDPICKNGLAYLTLSSLLEGTQKLNFKDLHKKLNENGIIVEIHPSYDRSTITFKGIEKDISIFINLLFDMFFFPSFPEKRIKKLKRKILGEISERDEIPQEVGFNSLKRLIFRGTPFQFPTIGSRGTLENIETKDIETFHKNFYTPSNSLLLIATQYSLKSINEIDRLISIKNNEFKNIKLEKPKKSIPFYEIVPFDTEQSHIFIGNRGIKRKNRDFYKLLLLETIIGGEENFVNILQQNIREKLGLCYDIYSSFTEESSKREGLIYFYGGVSPKNEELFIENIFKIIKRVKNKKIGKIKIEQSKRFLIYNFFSKFQDTENFINYILHLKTYNISTLYFQNFKRIISPLNEKDLKYVLEKYFDIGSFSTVVVKAI